jgi:hypothetical protein
MFLLTELLDTYVQDTCRGRGGRGEIRKKEEEKKAH